MNSSWRYLDNFQNQFYGILACTRAEQQPVVLEMFLDLVVLLYVKAGKDSEARAKQEEMEQLLEDFNRASALLQGAEVTNASRKSEAEQLAILHRLIRRQVAQHHASSEQFEVSRINSLETTRQSACDLVE